ncbi:MAG: hypothetical protein M0R74_06960 [Dehalococcoidia bacterium]|nr:hypothetical protein [Dehalococcoidia bacterium]
MVPDNCPIGGWEVTGSEARAVYSSSKEALERMRQVQERLRNHLPEGVSLADELIRGRRREDVRESETVATYTWGLTRIEPGTVRLLDLSGVQPSDEDLAAMKRAQAIVRRSIPEGRSLVDELIAERRREAAGE